MKTSFFVFLLVSVILQYSHPLYSEEMYVGIKAGANLATWWGATSQTSSLGDLSLTLDPYSQRKLKPGLVVGIFAEKNLSRFSDFSIQPELLFCMKGYQNRNHRNDPFDSIITSITLNYLELPILIKWNLGSQALGYCFYTGPCIAIRIGVGGTNENAGESLSDADKEYLKKYTSFFDWGFSLGAAFEKKIGSGKIVLDLRGTLDFIPINTLSDFQKSQGISENTILKDKNMGFSIMAGYVFSINTPSAFYK